MYKFWYDYLKPKYNDRVKLCSRDTDSFIINIETEDFYTLLIMFDTSYYDKNDKRPLPIGKNKKVIGLFKDELGRKIIIEVVAHRAKTCIFTG